MIAFLAAEGADVGNGYWLPHDLNEVIWGTIAFVLVFGLIVWKAGPAIKKALNARPERISGELAAAESVKAEAEAERDRIKEALADSDAEAARIVEAARQSADRLRVDGETRALADAQILRDRAAHDIVSARRQAESDLVGEVSRLALGAAEKVVHNNLDDATQQALIESFISQVGANN